MILIYIVSVSSPFQCIILMLMDFYKKNNNNKGPQMCHNSKYFHSAGLSFSTSPFEWTDKSSRISKKVKGKGASQSV